MKQLFVLLIALMLILTACSEKDDKSSTEPGINYAYKLDQFVPEDVLASMVIHDEEDNEDVDSWSSLFYFWPVATDGFSQRNRGYDDIDLVNWTQGYYLPFDNNKLSFPQYEEQNIGSYNVKYMDKVYVFRGVQTICSSKMVLHELNAMSTEQVENYDGELESAIPLSDFVTEQITQVDSVKFTAADGYSQVYSSEEISAGYWLIDSQKTIFPGLDLPGSKKKFKWLMTFEVFGTWQDNEEFVNPNLGDMDEADWNFSFPEDLSEYEGTEWE